MKMEVALSVTERDERRRRLSLILGLGMASIALWQFPLGSLLLYPFAILATWFHEMGHGLMATLMGFRFHYLIIFADGSGYASILTPIEAGRIRPALVAAAGPLGPAIVGSLFILSSRTDKGAKRALRVLGWFLIVSTVIWVRSPIGWALLPGLGFIILAIRRFCGPLVHRLSIQILGLEACISVWRQFDYLFSAGGTVGGRQARSDTAAIQAALMLPYWLWGALISLVIVIMLGLSLRAAYRR